MVTALLTDVPESDLANFIREAQTAISGGASMQLKVGETSFGLDAALAESLLRMLAMIANGHGLEVNALPEVITTGQAADLLGVSRPTVVALVDQSVLPATRVGKHRRLKRDDVLAYREQVATRRSGHLTRLVQISEELGLYDEK